MIIPSLQHSNMHMCILSSTHTQIIQLQIPCACCYVFYFHIIINLYFFNLINLFLTILSLCCCMGFSQVAVSRGHSLVAAASLVAEIELQGVQASVVARCVAQKLWSSVLEHRLNSCGAQAQLLCGMWDLPRPRDQACISPCIGRQILYHPATREASCFFLYASRLNFCYECKILFYTDVPQIF